MVSPSNGTTFLVAILVPAAAVFVIILWTVLAYFKFRALVRAHPAAARSIAEQGADRPQSTLSAARRTSKLLASIPPPPASPTFTIQTGISRSGSRVLVRGRRSSSKRREGEKAPKPERTRKVAAWGVGEGGSSQGGDLDIDNYAAQGFASAHLRQHSAGLPSVPPTSPFQLGFNTSIRRRNGTWHEHDLEILTSAAPPLPPVVIFSPVGERPLFGARISSSEGDHVEAGGAGSQESGYEANGLLAGTRLEQEQLAAEEEDEDFRRYTSYTALDMRQPTRAGGTRAAEASQPGAVRPRQLDDATPPLVESPRAMSLYSQRQPTISNTIDGVPPIPPRNPARQHDPASPSSAPYPDPTRSPSSRYSSQSALPSQPHDRTSTYTTPSQQSHYPHPHRLSVVSNLTDSHTDSWRPATRPLSGETTPIRHHSLGPSGSHRLSYPSSSPFALQRARSDPPPHDTHRISRDVFEESDHTSNTFGVPDLRPHVSRTMSPDALEELELVVSRFEATKASLLAAHEEPNRAYPPRPPYWLTREDSSGTLPDRAPLDEASRLKVRSSPISREQARRSPLRVRSLSIPTMITISSTPPLLIHLHDTDVVAGCCNLARYVRSSR